MRSEIEISVETTGSHHLISASSLNSACRGLLEAEGPGGEAGDGLCGMVVGGDTAVMSVCFFECSVRGYGVQRARLISRRAKVSARSS
ncbi:hypothetical protein D3C81_1992760 [compost metagenome]